MSSGVVAEQSLLGVAVATGTTEAIASANGLGIASAIGAAIGIQSAAGSSAGIGIAAGIAPTYATGVAAGAGAADAVGTTPAHRYWRVFAETNNGDASFIGVGELEMYTAVYSGANVITGGTISASSVFSGTFPASKAIDGIYTSGRWASASTGGTDEWLKYDFGVGVSKEIVSIAAFSADTEFDQTWKDIRIEHSDDDSNWTTAWTDTQVFTTTLQFKRSSDPGAVPSYSGSPYGTHTYWRILFQTVNGTAISAAEVEFRATTGGGDQATGGTPTVSATTLGSAANIFDNNNATHWAVNGGPAAWLKYQFASPVTVGEIAYRIRGDSSATHSPNTFLVQFSDDNSVWATAWQVTGQTAWSLGEQRVFTSPDYV